MPPKKSSTAKKSKRADLTEPVADEKASTDIEDAFDGAEGTDLKEDDSALGGDPDIPPAQDKPRKSGTEDLGKSGTEDLGKSGTDGLDDIGADDMGESGLDDLGKSGADDAGKSGNVSGLDDENANWDVGGDQVGDNGGDDIPPRPSGGGSLGASGSGPETGFEEHVTNAKDAQGNLQQLQMQHRQINEAVTSGARKNEFGEETPDPGDDIDAKKDSAGAQQTEKFLNYGLVDTDFIIHMNAYLKENEAEKKVLRAQIKRLCQENNWLREQVENNPKGDPNDPGMNPDAQDDQQQFGEGQEGGKGADDIDMDIDRKEWEKNQEPSEEEKPEEDDSQKQGSVLDEDEEPEQYSNDVPTKLRTLNNMVNQYLEEGRAETCVPLCKKAYADIQKELGENHPDLATVMCILAKVYRHQCKYEEAKAVLKQALEIRQVQLSPEHPMTGAIHCNLASVQSQTGQNKDAKANIEKAISIKEKSGGPGSDFDVGALYRNLGRILRNMKEYDEAAAAVKKAISILQRKLKADDPEMLKTKNDMGVMLMENDKLEEAENVFSNLIKNAITFQGSTETSDGEEVDPADPGEEGAGGDVNWQKVEPIPRREMAAVIKNLSETYKGSGKGDAAKVVEEFSIRMARNTLEMEARNDLVKILQSGGTEVPRNTEMSGSRGRSRGSKMPGSGAASGSRVSGSGGMSRSRVSGSRTPGKLSSRVSASRDASKESKIDW
ncbi:uncharacterized protein LOC142342096 isoform X2 [Convolutriloba macropyga]|uniref:uncharacterized protein LOC142342096 isoform X2 n=1 Tax=Convolutriloba macropyga TaxID=536237 RepID=UPI003F51F7D1